MQLRYRGINSPTGRATRTGCGACGGARLGRTDMALMNPYTYFYRGRQFTFHIGRVVDVPDELAETLLQKYSYVNGHKLSAFEQV